VALALAISEQDEERRKIEIRLRAVYLFTQLPAEQLERVLLPNTMGSSALPHRRTVEVAYYNTTGALSPLDTRFIKPPATDETKFNVQHSFMYTELCTIHNHTDINGFFVKRSASCRDCVIPVEMKDTTDPMKKRMRPLAAMLR